MSTAAPLAHSAPEDGREPQRYADHIAGVVARARRNAEAIAAYMPDIEHRKRFVTAVVDAATFHDLGKLDPDNQSALREGRTGRMTWDHIDAGVAHLLRNNAVTAAWVVRAHHAPGLPSRAEQFGGLNCRRLRGGRLHGGDADALTDHTDRTLPDLLARHMASTGVYSVTPCKLHDGMALRLGVSCVVDGDHADASFFDYGRRPPEPILPRWEERLARLDAYVAALPRGGDRQADRDDFYHACRHGSLAHALVACTGPVGIGKTTAVLAWLLRRAIESNARRLFIVAPFITILSQIVEIIRKVLLLDDELDRAEEVIAEHHHRAEFSDPASRDLALQWQAPIIVTTGVQFFETLAACEPVPLRKLQALPGSVVFLDEAHAALPTPLWRQNWAWMCDLAANWGCSFAFASGSLARVWKYEDVVGQKAVSSLPDLAGDKLSARLTRAEYNRVRYATLDRPVSLEKSVLDRPGPRLVVFNTVQTAAVMARRLRQAGADVLHLSTALCPNDRVAILAEVKCRLELDSGYPADWTLVATSLIEAGVDLSFRTGFRERFSTASLIQIGGRVNRHGHGEPGWAYDFLIPQDELLTVYPGMRASTGALEWLLTKEHAFDGPVDAAELVERALLQEIRDAHGRTGEALAQAETDRNYPDVARLGRLIDADTAFVVVKPELVAELEAGMPVSTRRLLGGSVHLWRKRIDDLGLRCVSGRPGLYSWPHAYDADFLGYMAGALDLKTGEAFLI